jgi:indole-3-acetate monooxygenase
MKNPIEHPSALLSKTLTDEIRDTASAAEHEKSLHAVQLKIIHQQRWLNMYVPAAYGGLGLTLPDILRVEECLAWADGSTAWVVTLCSGAAWFVGFLNPEVAREVFADDNVCFAGSGAITGTANRTNDFYELSGYWKYATGAHHATVFTVNCIVKENGQPLYNEDKTPLVYSFLLKRNEVTIHDTWHGMGMVATGSHAIEVKSLRVPLNRSFIIDPVHTKLSHDIFKFPFLQLAQTTLAVNLSGMACRFLDLCFELFSTDATAHPQTSSRLTLLRDRRGYFNACRQQFYEQSDAAWEILVAHSPIPASVLEAVNEASHHLAHCSYDVATELYPYCGLAAADTRNEINRVWRNLLTASQHSLFRFKFKV